MKNMLIVLCLSINIVFPGCNTKNPGTKITLTDTIRPTKPVKKFAGLIFESKKDTTCGMPITAGIEDTLLLRGKIYGFCSTTCKDEFLTFLQKQHKK
ncbi:MAG: hypothetical protein ABIQ31_11160 [Ferruginibacter sp.]